MANPVMVNVPANAWTKVATNVTSGVIYNISNLPLFQTYRMTGDPAPTSREEGVDIGDGEAEILSGDGIDIYLWSNSEGKIRLDI